MSSPDTPSLAPESEPRDIAPALGESVGRGVAWMLLNTGWSRLVGLVAQYFLAAWLSKGDFGVYSVALSFGILAMSFKDGGARQVLIQRGAGEYPRLAGSVFWLALLFNTLAGGVLAGAAPLVARVYHDQRYVTILLLLAVWLPMSTPGAIMSAKLWTDLRAGPYCVIQMGSALVRFGGAILLARLGFGPTSWAWPMVAMAAYETIAYLLVTRDTAWLRRPDLSLWAGLVRTSKWVMLLAMAIATFNQGMFAVIGKIATPEATGVFSFASQIVMQVEILVAFNLHQVLMPSLVRLNAEPQRQRDALLRAMRTLTLIAAPAGLGVALIFEPVEQLLWHGKWAQAVVPVQILALFMSARVLYAIPDAILQARGRFKRLSIMVTVLGLGTMTIAGIGSWLGGGNPVAISLWVGMYLTVACVSFAMAALWAVGVHPGSLLRAIGPAWAVAVGIAAATWGIDHAWFRALPPFERAALVAAVFALLMTPAARLLLARHLEEAVRILPGRVRSAVMRIMRLSSPGERTPHAGDEG